MRKTYARAPVKRRKKKRKFIVSTFLIIVLISIIFLKVFELKTFTVTGGSRYSEQEMRELLVTEPTDRVSLFFWLRMRLFGEGEIPFVEKVEIDLTGRGSVEVTVHDKLVTGCVEQMGSYLYFDREGMVVESSRVRLADVPVVTGLKFKKIVLRERMVTAKEGIFEVILSLTRLIRKEELAVTEIAFAQDGSVTLYIDGSVVLLGKREHYDEVLSVLKSLLLASGELKLKFDMTAYENGNNHITAQPLTADGDDNAGTVEPGQDIKGDDITGGGDSPAGG
ncbi:MAG: cell division protein FtsQ/DivIB, partial [Lachnospiraceae bacterium]|nr:cell division protein FtsQ/DivIB [Lachnospiraceae bacterium]